MSSGITDPRAISIEKREGNVENEKDDLCTRKHYPSSNLQKKKHTDTYIHAACTPAADLNVFLLNTIMTITNYMCGAGKRTLAMHLVKHKEPIIASSVKYSATAAAYEQTWSSII